MGRQLARVRSGSLPMSKVDPAAVAYWHAALHPDRARARWVAWALLAVAVVITAVYGASAVDQRTLAIGAGVAAAGFIAWRTRALLPSIEWRISWRWIWLLLVLARLVYRLSIP